MAVLIGIRLWKQGPVIGREDLDAGRGNLSNVIERRKRLPPVPPERVLQEDFLSPMDIPAARLARDLHVPRGRVRALLQGRSLTAEMALRLGQYFGMSAKVWMNLQGRSDLERARRRIGPKIAREVIPLAMLAGRRRSARLTPES